MAQAPFTAVAIVGIGCYFPGASGLKPYLRLLLSGQDAIDEVPASHWSAQDYFDPDRRKPDRVYCTRGGYLAPIAFDPTDFGIPPSALEATDTSQLLGLLAARQALEDGGYGAAQRPFNRDRVSVILGVTGTQELVVPLSSRLAHPQWRRALRQAGLPEHRVSEICQRIADGFVPWQESSFPGLLGNVVAGRICNRLDLRGTNCTVDAACASSLSAVNLALLELAARRADMVLTGGVDTLNDIFMHMCFTRSQILSPTGDVRPFSKDADGTVLGEGVGLLLLKRLDEAERDGDRIYAVIRGLGTSSDGRSQSIYAPRAQGQAKALRDAYETAGISPASVELVEAHGTGTRVGDQVEVEALRQVFEAAEAAVQHCALGSVKSNIGHTKAAAGTAGLIKAALALHHKALPPTLKTADADPGLKLEGSPFYLNRQLRPWPRPAGHPRRAAVSAFGFGGSNYHLLLEEHRSAKAIVSWDGSVEILAVSGDSPERLRMRIEALQQALADRPSPQQVAFQAAASRLAFRAEERFRLLATFGPQSEPQAAQEILKAALAALQRHAPATAWREGNLFYGSPTPPGKTAFLFPGQGSQYAGMGRDPICCFPQALAALEEARETAGAQSALFERIFPIAVDAQAEAALRATEVAQPAIGAVSMALLRVLSFFGIQPDATCGHSFGELTALHAAGWISASDFLRLAMLRGTAMAAAAAGSAAGAMLAVQAPLAAIEQLPVVATGELVLANRNSPEQGVLSGSERAVSEAEAACRARGWRTVRLPVSAAFHSPHMAPAQRTWARALGSVPFTPTPIAVLANFNAERYPHSAVAARRLLNKQLTEPVDFLGCVQRLYAEGVRQFVEVGPRGVLTRLVQASLAEHTDVHAMALDGSGGRGSGLLDLAQTLCQLASLGLKVRLDAWEEPATRPSQPRMQIWLSGANVRPAVRIEQIERVPATPAAQIQAPLPLTPTSETAVRSMPVQPPKLDAPIGANRANSDILRLIRDGLTSIQQLQQQTADAHRLFLETQAENSRALQALIGRIESLSRGAPPSVDVLEQVQPAPPGQGQAAAAAAVKTPPVLPAKGVTPVPVSPPKPLVPQASIAATPTALGAQSPSAVPYAAVTPQVRPATDEAAITAALLAAVSQLTGYPRETLHLSMDIESDLGIDSIKRVEILSELEERLPGLPPISPEIMGTLRSLQQIVQHLACANAAETPTAPAAQTPSMAVSATCPPAHPASAHKAAQRHVAMLQPAPPLRLESCLELSGGQVAITDDGGELAAALADCFARRGLSVKLASPEALKSDTAWANQISGLVILPPDRLWPDRLWTDKGWNGQSVAFLQSALRLARSAAPALRRRGRGRQGSLLAVITRLDGGFGLQSVATGNPILAGLPGLAKTAALEWPEVRCRAIDLAPVETATSQAAAAQADRLATELLASGMDLPIEVGLAGEARLTPRLVPAEASDGELDLAAGDLVLVSGGARGVTAAAILELATRGPLAFGLIGRSPLPEQEPAWLRGLSAEAEIKQALHRHAFAGRQPTPADLEQAYRHQLAAREIRQTLAQLAARGCQASYHALDVRDSTQANPCLARLRASHGPVRALIHGAGVIADRAIVDKRDDQIHAVLSTKLLGLHALLQATRNDALRHIVLFSSVSAHFGNAGQADYAMANAALNQIARLEATRRPDCRVVAINWGPWQGGMVSPSLQRQFASRGVALLPLPIGAQAMVREMCQPSGTPAEVIIGSPLPMATPAESAPAPQPDATPAPVLTLTQDVDLQRYPVLASHMLAGKPVVPFALMAEWFGHGALHNHPGLVFQGLEQMRLLAGIKIEGHSRRIRLLSSRAAQDGARFAVPVELRDGHGPGGEDIIHCRGRVILGEGLPKAPAFDHELTRANGGYRRSIDEVYERILFHGQALRGLRAVLELCPDRMVAQLASAPAPTQWIATPYRRRWLGDPLVLDAAFQMASLWCYEIHGRVSLPTYCAAYRQFRPRFPATGVLAVMQPKEVTGHRLRADVTFLDEKHEVVAQLAGLEAVMDDALYASFKPNDTAPLPVGAAATC